MERGEYNRLISLLLFRQRRGLREIVTKSAEEAFGLGGVDFREWIVIDCGGLAERSESTAKITMGDIFITGNGSWLLR